MKATWDRLEKNVVQFAVEVEAERLTQAMDGAFRKLNGKANIRGFRKGKAPRFIYERYYGKAAILEEALTQLIPQAFNEAVNESGLEPIDEPQFDLETAEEGKDLSFKAKVEVKPEVKLGRLKGFDGIKYETPLVTEIQVDEQLEALRERAAQLVPDDSGLVQRGSFAVIDFEGFLSGEPFEGGKAEDFNLEIGGGRFVPGFEEQLEGAQVGDAKDINVTFPEDYQASNLAGKEVVFKVKVKDLKKKELPEVDDSFAQQVSRFQTLQELRDDLTNRLKEAAEREAKRAFEDKLVQAVVADAEVEVPEVLVHRRQHTLLHDLEHDMQSRGISMEQYMQITNKDQQQIHNEMREPALASMKNSLVLEAVAVQEGITVGDDEVEAEIDKMVASFGNEAAARKRQLQSNPEYFERIRYSLSVQKAVQHLANINK